MDLSEDPVVESLKGSFLVHGHALHYLQPKALLASPQELLAVIVDDVHTLKGSEEPRYNISARLSTQATQLLLAELKLGKKVGGNLEVRKKELTPYNNILVTVRVYSSIILISFCPHSPCTCGAAQIITLHAASVTPDIRTLDFISSCFVSLLN